MIKSQIEKKLNEILSKFVEGKIKNDIELLNIIRKESSSSHTLFYFLLEKFLEIAYHQNILILSKSVLRYYLKSRIKEDGDYIYIGDVTKNLDDSIKIDLDTYIEKGLFIKIIEKMNLKKTLDSYKKFLIVNEDEIDSTRILNENEIKKFKQIDSVIHVFWKEFDSVVPKGKRYIKFNSKGVKS